MCWPTSIRIAETGGRVCVGELATVCADPLQMRLLIQNLVGNALKFHHPERSPHVTVTGAWRDNQDVSSPNGHDVRRAYALQVSDNGIGFERDYAERIFQMFQRLHGRSEYEGTGVGLAICRKIVERHGGTIVATAGTGPRRDIYDSAPRTTGSDGTIDGRAKDGKQWADWLIPSQSWSQKTIRTISC